MSEHEGARASGLRFEPWDGHGGLRASEALWRALLEECDLDPLCNTPEWVRAYAEACVPDADVFGWRVRDGHGAPVAFLAFRREPSRGRLALRRALLLCDGTFDSDYIDLVIAAGREREVLAGALDALAHKPGVDAMLVSSVLEDSPTLKTLGTLLEERHLPSRAATIECAAAPLPETFEAYLQTLKKRMRSKVRQALRLAQEKGAALVWCREPEALERELEGLFRLHAMRWEAAGEAGAFASEGRCRFYQSFARDALAAGMLRFSRLDVDGRAVAYQFGVRAKDAYYQMQEGFDVGFGDARVATALRALSIEAMIAEGVSSYDFMAGISRHKRDWGAQQRNCASLAFALPNLRARLSYGARSLVDRFAAGRRQRA